MPLESWWTKNPQNIGFALPDRFGINDALKKKIGSQMPSPEPPISASDVFSAAIIPPGMIGKAVAPLLKSAAPVIEGSSPGGIIADLARSQLGGILERLTRRSFGTGNGNDELALVNKATRAIQAIESYGQPVENHVKRLVGDAAARTYLRVSRIRQTNLPIDALMASLIRHEQLLQQKVMRK